MIVDIRAVDSQRISFEFREFAANSFGLRIRYDFAVNFTDLQIRDEFTLCIR